MKVYVYPADTFACGHYRMVWPALALQQSEPDMDITIIPAGDPTGMSVLADRAGNASDVSHPECDLVVFQRPTFPQIAQAVPILRRRGIAVVVDIDDDLGHIHPDNPAWIAMHPDALRILVRGDDGLLEGAVLPKQLFDDAFGNLCVTLGGRTYRVLKKRPSPHSWRAVAQACGWATMTTVSTPALTQTYGNGNAVALRNYIPRKALEVARQDSDDIGWAGSTHSHPGDLKAMGGAIARIGRGFKVVGSGKGAERELGIPGPVPDTGNVEFSDWPVAVSSIGIGVAPLQDSRFNTAKSWLKPLEYSAVGVPWVASPRAEYRALAGLGAGVTAEKPREWERELRRLLEPGFRAEQSEAVRAIARTLTIEGNAWRTAEAWREAVDRQRATSRRAAAV